jgi:uncharacterized membrane protein YidH (DUF202 family)
VSDSEERESLAAERTALAWGRTSLALLACGAAAIRGVPSVTGRGARPVAGSVIVALAAACWLQSLWSEHHRRVALARGETTDDSSLRGVAMTTVVIGLVGFVVALAG